MFEEVCGGLDEIAGLKAADLEVSRFERSDDLVVIQLRTTEPRKKAREGDLLSPGISLVHSASGDHPTQVFTYIHRVICSNGMTIRVCERGQAN